MPAIVAQIIETRGRPSWVAGRRQQRYRFVIKSPNGRTLAHSEHYTNRADCAHALRLVVGPVLFSDLGDDGSRWVIHRPDQEE